MFLSVRAVFCLQNEQQVMLEKLLFQDSILPLQRCEEVRKAEETRKQ